MYVAADPARVTVQGTSNPANRPGIVDHEFIRCQEQCTPGFRLGDEQPVERVFMTGWQVRRCEGVLARIGQAETGPVVLDISNT